MFNVVYLHLLLALPIFGAAVVYVFPATMRWAYANAAVGFSLITLFVALLFWADFTSQQYFSSTLVSLYLANYNMQVSVGVDGLSLLFVLLTVFLFPFCMLSV